MALQFQWSAMVSHVRRSYVSVTQYLITIFQGYRNACFLTLGLGCLTSIFVTLTPGLDNPKYNSFRASLFVFLGCSAAAPLIIMQYHEKYSLDLPFTLYVVGGAVYIVGAVVYVIGYPERFRTGHFDNCGASHQIFHFLVLTGCLIHYIENYRAYIKNQDMICPAWYKTGQETPAIYF